MRDGTRGERRAILLDFMRSGIPCGRDETTRTGNRNRNFVGSRRTQPCGQIASSRPGDELELVLIARRACVAPRCEVLGDVIDNIDTDEAAAGREEGAPVRSIGSPVSASVTSSTSVQSARLDTPSA